MSQVTLLGAIKVILRIGHGAVWVTVDSSTMKKDESRTTKYTNSVQLQHQYEMQNSPILHAAHKLCLLFLLTLTGESLIAGPRFKVLSALKESRCRLSLCIR